MPFLRVIRDRRGYEVTYLMHWYRDGAKQRSRILYVFRSPGGARVGRDSLDADVRREIEAQHPEIDFDWRSVLANRQTIESAAEPRRPRGRRRTEAEAAPPPAAPAPRREVASAETPAGPAPLPAALQGATPDEQIAFLTEWYPIIRARVQRRTSEPARLEALLALADRLNPAAWTDADQIAEGLQRASEALDRLSRVFSRRRRRRRPAPSPPGDGSPPAGGPPPADDPAPAES